MMSSKILDRIGGRERPKMFCRYLLNMNFVIVFGA